MTRRDAVLVLADLRSPTLPSSEEIQQAISARDVRALVALDQRARDALAVDGGVSRTAALEAVRLVERIGKAITELSAVAMSNRPGPTITDTTPARTESARAALASVTETEIRTGDDRRAERESVPLADRLADARRALGGRP